MNWDQRLRNAIYEVKFANMPGTHDNGIYREELTVEEALDKVARIMGITASTPKPLYWIEDGLLYSRVTSRMYDVLIIDDDVKVQYGGRWYGCGTERQAMNFINRKELEESATDAAIRDGHFEYYA